VLKDGEPTAGMGVTYDYLLDGGVSSPFDNQPTYGELVEQVTDLRTTSLTSR
jgi:hypothetical protein